MDVFLLVFLAALIVNRALFNRFRRRRSTLLAQHLRPYQIEKLMETLIEGYLRAMGEKSPERRAQILEMLHISERQLSDQFERFAADFARVGAQAARVSRLPLNLPLALHLCVGPSFDMRRALAIHARGITRVMCNEAGLSPRDRAFMMTAELLLMQHTCHWFCESGAVASARAIARHRTPYAQIVASVSPETRAAYQALLQQRA
jgi:hypothetical protein